MTTQIKPNPPMKRVEISTTCFLQRYFTNTTCRTLESRGEGRLVGSFNVLLVPSWNSLNVEKKRRSSPQSWWRWEDGGWMMKNPWEMWDLVDEFGWNWGLGMDEMCLGMEGMWRRRDCLCYSDGVKNSLREDCDIIVVGEIRDRETMDAAILY